MSLRTRQFMILLLAAGLAGALLPGCGNQPSEPLLERALAKIREGKYDAAALYLEQALEREPENPHLMIQLGIAYMHMGRLDDAARTFIRAADTARTDPRPLEFLAIIHKKQGQLGKARHALRQANALEPSPRVITSLALIEVSDGNLELAAEYLQEALQRDANYPSALFNLARLHHQKLRDPDLARTYYERFLKIAPNHKRAQAARGALRALDSPEALKVTGRSADDSPAGETPDAAAPTGHVITAGMRYRLHLKTKEAQKAVQRGDLDVALEILKDAVREDPLNPDAFWELVIMYDQHVDNKRRSIRGYSYFQEKFPDDGRAILARRRIQELMAKLPAGDFERHLERTRRAELEPDIERAGKAFVQGRMCHESGDMRSASHYYKIAIAADPYHSQAFHNLGLVARELGDLRSAQKSLEEAVSIRPDSTESWYALARVLIALDQHDTARSKLQRLLALQSNAAEAYYLLGVIQISAGEHLQARQAYKEYIALAPNGQFAQDANRWLTQQPN